MPAPMLPYDVRGCFVEPLVRSEWLGRLSVMYRIWGPSPGVLKPGLYAGDKLPGAGTHIERWTGDEWVVVQP